RRDTYDQQHQYLPLGDAEEAAEQQGVDPVEKAVVEAHEEKAGCEREGLHDADAGRLLAVALAPLGPQPGDEQGGPDAEPEEAPRSADAEPHGARGAREADEGEGVAGERLAAQDHEPADGA